MFFNPNKTSNLYPVLDTRTTIKMKVGDIKQNSQKLLYLKNKLFFQDVNAKVMKVQDFNTNFPYKNYQIYLNKTISFFF